MFVTMETVAIICDELEFGVDIDWNLQRTEEDIRVAVKTKAKEVSMEEALWKSADKLRGSVEPSEYITCGIKFVFPEICK